MTFWTLENLTLAEQVFGRHTSYDAALTELQSLLGPNVTKYSLQKALLRAGMPSPSALLGRLPSATVVAPAKPAKRAVSLTDEPLIEKLVRETKNGKSFEDLANKLDVSPGKLQMLIEKAKQLGYRVDVAHDTVAWKPTDAFDDEQEVPMLAKAGEYQCFAVASDLHIGSKHFLQRQLEDFVDIAYAAGVRNCLIPGDLLDGNMKFLIWDQSHQGLQRQADHAVEVLPQRPGWRWDFIIGNHEESFELMSGIDCGQALVNIFKSAGRNDLHYHGPRSAYVRLVSPGAPRGLLIEMQHPKGAPSYAVSYKLQRHIDSYNPGQKGDVVLQGHFHQSGYFTRRGVHALLAGTFQSGRSAFQKSLDGAPSTGGWIVKYALTPEGTVRRFMPEFIAYYDKEEVRPIELG